MQDQPVQSNTIDRGLSVSSLKSGVQASIGLGQYLTACFSDDAE